MLAAGIGGWGGKDCTPMRPGVWLRDRNGGMPRVRGRAPPPQPHPSSHLHRSSSCQARICI
eukprot:355791-Chlamydomonas_euryale.AAC.17